MPALICLLPPYRRHIRRHLFLTMPGVQHDHAFQQTVEVRQPNRNRAKEGSPRIKGLQSFFYNYVCSVGLSITCATAASTDANNISSNSAFSFESLRASSTISTSRASAS